MTKIDLNKLKEKQKDLYNQLYNLTNPLCKQCRAPQSCCAPEYCEMAMEIARVNGETLPPPIPNVKIPFLHPQHGCILKPYQRPLCTRHHCSINSLGHFPNNSEATKKYFELVEAIDKIEYLYPTI